MYRIYSLLAGEISVAFPHHWILKNLFWTVYFQQRFRTLNHFEDKVYKFLCCEVDSGAAVSLDRPIHLFPSNSLSGLQVQWPVAKAEQSSGKILVNHHHHDGLPDQMRKCVSKSWSLLNGVNCSLTF